MTKPITINLDEAQALELERVARESGVSVDEIVREAIELLAHEHAMRDGSPLTEDEKAKIQAGLDAIERGETIEHDELFARLEAKYGT